MQSGQVLKAQAGALLHKFGRRAGSRSCLLPTNSCARSGAPLLAAVVGRIIRLNLNFEPPRRRRKLHIVRQIDGDIRGGTEEFEPWKGTQPVLFYLKACREHTNAMQGEAVHEPLRVQLAIKLPRAI